MKKTPLYDIHIKHGGKIVDFSGWALPIQYTGIIKEHEQVRNAAGLFDVSHMGEIRVTGSNATEYIQRLITNNIKGIDNNKIIYSPMCYPEGGVIDDLLVYKYDDKDYLLVVNASNTDKDFEWLLSNKTENVEIKNVSDNYAQLALQGPLAQTILQKLTNEPLDEIKFFHFKSEVDLDGIKALVSRTGYTGEDGFEIYIESVHAVDLWEKLMNVDTDLGLVPVGLGARDTLRFEAGLPLYGHEISKDISPLEAGLGFFVKLDKGDFIGKSALLNQKQTGIKRKLVGFEMLEKGIPRSGYDVQINNETIGFVTTGSFSPTLKKQIGLALVNSEYANIETELNIVIRNKPLKAKVVKKPFYKI